MFERITRNIVPPEMAALLLPATTSPKVKGYMFRREGINLYHCVNGSLTILRKQAYVYTAEQVELATLNSWSWGRKPHGKWVVVYA